MKVSVIVPIYNAESYLKQCLDSVIGQTLEDIEIILVNDGSIDGSAEICKQYLHDSRVIYFYKENEGLAAARKDGIKLAHGEYIGFVDSDDWLELDAYERMYASAKTCDADIVFCNVVENEDGHRMSAQLREGAFNRQEILADILPKALAYVNKDGAIAATRWSNCLRLYKKSMLDENHIEFDKRFRRSQDLQLTYEATLVAKNYYYMGDAYLYHNRVVSDSLSRGYTKNMWQYYKILIERLYKDSEEFQDLDMMPAMHLRAFSFIISVIKNEFKELCPNDYQTRGEKIREVMNDPLCERLKGKLPLEQLAKPYRMYYRLIMQKKPEALMRYTRRYVFAQEHIREPFDKAKGILINFVTESRLTGRLYKKVRCLWKR